MFKLKAVFRHLTGYGLTVYNRLFMRFYKKPFVYRIISRHIAICNVLQETCAELLKLLLRL